MRRNIVALLFPCASHAHIVPASPSCCGPRAQLAGACPRCSSPLEVHNIHVAGWRSLVRGILIRCRGRFLQDLPSGHGLLYPASLDPDTGETIAPRGAEWFSEPLRVYLVAWQAALIHRGVVAFPLRALLAKPLAAAVLGALCGLAVAQWSEVAAGFLSACVHAIALQALGYLSISEWAPLIDPIRRIVRRRSATAGAP